MTKLNWVFKKCTQEKENRFPEHDLWGWREGIRSLKEFECTDFEKLSSLCSSLYYSVNTFHKFISAIYSLKNTFAS